MQIFIDDFWISPYAMFAFVAAKEKGLKFETKQVALQSGQQKTGAFADLSWTGKIPVLIDDNGFSVSESLAIVEYLDEKYPFPDYPRLLPANVEDRARARQIMNWLNSDMLGLRSDRSTHTVFYTPAKNPLGDVARRDAERLLDLARRTIVGGRVNLFDRWCIADTVLAMMLTRLVASGDPVPDYVKSYVDGQWARPSVAEFVRVKRKPYIAY